MRRRRPLLQVSTFPFLAVLLCAMGSLILILLVIDRRAKLAAHAKALQEVTRAETAHAEAAAAVRAEWEQRRRELHARLLDEESTVTSELTKARQETDAAASRAEQELTTARQLGERVKAEETRLAEQEKEVTTQRAEAAQAVAKTSADQAELRRLSTELETMEHALADLKAARERARKTHSLVPYHGKRGDNRHPIYLECAAAGLIFQPDHFVLEGTSARVSELRAEIRRRFTEQATGEKQPYLLFLVRPDGILAYHQTLAALQGVAFDYGYELVDQDWLFDFPESENAPGTRGDRGVAEKDKPVRPPPASRGTVRGLRPAESASSESVANGGRGVPASVGGFEPFMGTPRPSSAVGGSAAGTAPSSLHDTTDVGRGDPAPTSAGRGNSAPTGLGQGNAATSGVEWGSPATTGRTMVGRGDPPPTGVGQGNAAPSSRTMVGAGFPRPLESTDDPGKTASSEVQIHGAETIASPMGPAPKGQTDSAITITPLDGMPASSPAGGGTGTGTNRATTAKPSASPGEPSEPSPASGSAAGMLSTTERSPQPAPRLTGGRDWIIPVECNARAVVLYPSKFQIPADQLNQQGDQLRQQIQQMIARRQATVRPGEPPYRPQVRILVRPDGSGTYYRAYPLLEPIGVKMTRQNIDTAEEIRPGNFNH